MPVIRDLSAAAVAKMPPVDLADVTGPPASPFEPFVFHGCECRVASFKGEPPWELHTDGDELIHILAGGTRLTVRIEGADVVRQLRPGDLAVVSAGCWHRNYAPEGVTLLHMTPQTGNRNSWEDPDAAERAT